MKFFESLFTGNVDVLVQDIVSERLIMHRDEP